MPVPVIDGHNDVLQRIVFGGPRRHFDFFGENAEGHLDWARARAGCLAAGFFAMFVPNPEPEAQAVLESGGYRVPLAAALEPRYAADVVDRMAGVLQSLELESGGRIRLVTGIDALADCVADSVLGIVMHLEGAEAIDPELKGLQRLRGAGLRSLGVTWSRPNVFGHGVPFAFPGSPDTGPGLTDHGRRLVAECNRLGILVDLSHLDLAGFWDVAAISDRPLVATHSNAHALCPASRNLIDAQLDAVAASDGVVGINFAVSFLRADGKRDTSTPVSEIVRHARYMSERMGVEHVALGSDFDGADVPDEVRDVSGLPRVLEALRAGGFSDADIRKIAHENWLRVLRATWLD